MKTYIQHRYPLRFRRGLNSIRVIRITPATKFNFVFRPVRFGMKPILVRREVSESAAIGWPGESGPL